MIKTAVIPLAGLGTRMLPLTKALPKELWPLGEKSILEIILDECFDAGIKEVIFVISKRKEVIKNYFKKDHLLETKIKNNKNTLNKLKKLNKTFQKIKFVYQLLISMGMELKLPIIVCVDNFGSMFMSENILMSQRTKHVNICYRFSQ